MKIVADTNTFLAVALCEPEKEALTLAVAGHHLVAPEVLPFEIGNALTAMVKKKALEPKYCRDAWDAVASIPVELCQTDMAAALDIAISFNTYAYDAYFLECALRFRAPLLTLDRRMKRIASDLRIEIVELPK